MIDVQVLKQYANSRWKELFIQHGIPADCLTGKKGPCPKCQGIDRFRMLSEERGALFCNHCLNKENGDGIAALMWWSGCSFKEAVSATAQYFGIEDDGPTNVLTEVAWLKSTEVESLKKFGAAIADRNGTSVCRVPMHDADMKVVGYFDIAPGELEKGKMTPGSKHGLFVAERPEVGETVLIVEGVKDASALRSIPMLAVGLPTCRMDAMFARFFRDTDVIIIPDRDRAGVDGAAETASRLYGVANTVKIAELPADFKETGGADVRDVLRQHDGQMKLAIALEHAKPWIPPKEGKDTKEVRLVFLAEAVQALLDEEDQSAKLLKLGLPYVDKALCGGVLPGEMVIIAGRPSHGKSMMGVQALDYLARTVPVLLISEEMPVRSIAGRIVANLTEAKDSEWPSLRKQLKVQAANHFLGRQKYLIVECTGTIDKALETISFAKKEYNIGAVMVITSRCCEARVRVATNR